MIKIVAKHVRLRLVQIEDAEFIVSLRTHPRNAPFLSSGQITLDGQRRWIQQYKEKETAGQEYYFIISLSNDTAIGAIRIYDLRDRSFCWGSWALLPEAAAFAGIESVMAVYDFGFDHLKFHQSHFDVLKTNNKVIAFHMRFGAKKVTEDLKKIYFTIDKKAVESAKLKYSRYYVRTKIEGSE